MPAECTQITRQPGVKQHTYVLAPGEMETAFYLAYLTPWRLKVLPQRVYRDLVSHRFYRGIRPMQYTKMEPADPRNNTDTLAARIRPAPPPSLPPQQLNANGLPRNKGTAATGGEGTPLLPPRKIITTQAVITSADAMPSPRAQNLGLLVTRGLVTLGRTARRLQPAARLDVVLAITLPTPA